ncbi:MULTISPECIES: effector binding domain-containing protein [Paenibacillus]|uniref:effector binding domain-containing protein n=1 Tax=Paenibacillus TaxID=44249 RepID=UPI000B88E4D4|nr:MULTISPECIES: effector binding domain-containing protein [Paenibacillus]PRA09604.1 AraC family transcriptional regulator [Paenibacillus sp. MYb63]PRA46359.1 AraC family transcriptional regulator [Paenibacillus sp. MYb67]QZN73828.1 effector binding domain-containing protein [Paenibacillus sp. DR312]
MDHYTQIQLAIEYLEQHLQDDFNIRETSAAANFSAFHFQRLFQAITGFTVLEYVRRRRLTEAAGMLRGTSEGILDIAMSFGYQSQEAFTRAFSTYFGMTPAKLRKLEAEQLSLLKMQQSIDFNDYRTSLGGTFHMNTPRLVTLAPNWIIGYEYKTNLNDNQHYAEIPGFYHDFGMEQKFMAIPERTRPDMAYGVACHFEEDGAFSFIVGEESSGASQVLEPGFTSIEIPGGLYAEFTVEGSGQDIRKMIYGSWLPQSNYERREGPDFEVTDVWKSTPEQLDMKIYIPLK